MFSESFSTNNLTAIDYDFLKSLKLSMESYDPNNNLWNDSDIPKMARIQVDILHKVMAILSKTLEQSNFSLPCILSCNNFIKSIKENCNESFKIFPITYQPLVHLVSCSAEIMEEGLLLNEYLKMIIKRIDELICSNQVTKIEIMVILCFYPQWLITLWKEPLIQCLIHEIFLESY